MDRGLELTQPWGSLALGKALMAAPAWAPALGTAPSLQRPQHAVCRPAKAAAGLPFMYGFTKV